MGKVCVRWLIRSRTFRIVRSRPSLTPVVEVPEDIKVLLPTRRAWVVRFARGKFHAWDDKMEFVMLCMGMPHPENVILIRLKRSKGHRLKRLHQFFFHLRCDFFARRPREHSGCELPFTVLGVDQLFCGFRISAQNFRGIFFAPRVIHAKEVIHGPTSPAFPMREHFHVHYGSLFSSRRRASRRLTT